MAFDKHLLQQWVAGAELRFRKTREPLAALSSVPLLGKLTSVAQSTHEYTLTEKVDRAGQLRDAMHSSADRFTMGFDFWGSLCAKNVDKSA